MADDEDELEVLPRSETTEFAHNSERQFARLLDFYQIEWEYEPRSFDIGWDRNGEPNQRFRPDFYLPQYDTYIEITTLNQKLVTKKNRKVRLLRELYPDIKCKIFYQRDYQDLLIKYGLERPSQEGSAAGDMAESDSSEEDEDGPKAQVS
jgi:bifunctional protein TilS/HprT